MHIFAHKRDGTSLSLPVGWGTIMSSQLEEKKFLQEMLTPVEGESSSSAQNCWHLKTKRECSVTEFWLPRQNESPKLVLRLGFLFTHT